MAEQRVVVLGEARVDEIRDPGGVRENVTGDAVEIASALIGHGLALTVVAPVAEDADGERIRTALQDRGIRLVPVPAAEGTLRRSIVRDRSGAEVERVRDEGAFADTRRSLAAQAEADVIVDLRERDFTTVAEVRDEVLRALGKASPAPAAQGVAMQVPGTAEASAGQSSREPAPGDLLRPESVDGGEPLADASTTGVAGGTAARLDAAEAASSVLLPAPIVAGTYRHAPVRLLPDAPATPAPAPDWYGLEARLSRIAT